MKKNKVFFTFVFSALFVLLLAVLVSNSDVPVISTKGIIADQQKNYIILPVLLSFVVVIPVFFLLSYFAIKYKDTGPSRRIDYEPDWDSNKLYEFIWWFVPIVIIAILAVATWKGTHDLDPRKPIVSDQKPIQVQVIALNWKWLFIYPEENIATVNYLAIPEDRPVELTLTSDAPMNSFWIPQLAGQIYAMNGMSTKLHIQANEPGSYRGMSSNLSGEGFADMTFDAVAMDQGKYEKWLVDTRQVSDQLTPENYHKLAEKSIKNEPHFYGWVQNDLYSTIISKYRDSTHIQHENSIKHEGGH